MCTHLHIDAYFHYGFYYCCCWTTTCAVAFHSLFFLALTLPVCLYILYRSPYDTLKHSGVNISWTNISRTRAHLLVCSFARHAHRLPFIYCYGFGFSSVSYCILFRLLQPFILVVFLPVFFLVLGFLLLKIFANSISFSVYTLHIHIYVYCTIWRTYSFSVYKNDHNRL